MMDVLSVRLGKLGEIEQFSKLLNENRSEVVRTLVEEGKKLKAIELYKQKKISLGLGAKLAGMTLSDFLDLLEEYNVKLNLTLEDAKEAMKNAEKMV